LSEDRKERGRTDTLIKWEIEMKMGGNRTGIELARTDRPTKYKL
jgi:hypothetical protein